MSASGWKHASQHDNRRNIYWTEQNRKWRGAEACWRQRCWGQTSLCWTHCSTSYIEPFGNLMRPNAKFKNEMINIDIAHLPYQPLFQSCSDRQIYFWCFQTGFFLDCNAKITGRLNWIPFPTLLTKVMLSKHARSRVVLVPWFWCTR